MSSGIGKTTAICGKQSNYLWIVAASITAFLVLLVVLDPPYNLYLSLGIIVVLAISLLLAIAFRLSSVRLLSIWAFLLPFSVRIPLESFPLNLGYILIALIVFRHIIVHPHLRIPRSATSRILITIVFAFLMLLAITAMTGIDSANSIRKLYNTVNFALVFLATIQIVKSEKDVMTVMYALFASGVLLALLGLAQIGSAMLMGGGLAGANPVAAVNRSIVILTEGISVVNRVPDWTLWYRHNNWYSTPFGSIRATGTSWAPMGYAQILYITYFPVMAYTVSWRNRRGRALLIAVLIIQSAAIIATLSRGAWLGMGLGAATIGAYSLRGRILFSKRSVRRIAFLSLIAIILLIIVFPTEQLNVGINAFRSSFNPEVGISGFDSSNQARFRSYGMGLELIAANPMLGVGPGNFATAVEGVEGASSHNLYINYAAETGLVGLLLFISIMVLTFANLSYTARDSHSWYLQVLSIGWIASLVSLSFYWLFTAYLYEPKLQMMVWLVFGLGVSMHQLSVEERYTTRT